VRGIQDILCFRSDISPFLIHLTRGNEIGTAVENLTSILEYHFLISLGNPISDARFAVSLRNTTHTDKVNLFSAVSFSETPLNEIHCLLEISSREVNLEPYGVVFLKDNLKRKGVSPVIYINNERGDKDSVVRALATLRNSHPDAARQLLPLISVFGRRLRPVGGTYLDRPVDFTWEREWRYAAASGLFNFEVADVFLGLCPHEQISNFERQFAPISFIDPQRNVKWYAKKLVRARQRLGLKYSVV